MTGERILVVDDDPAIRNVVQRILSVRGFSVQGARSAEHALQHLGNKTFDGIVLDFHLPGFHGTALCRQLKDLSEVPILLLTSNSTLNLRALVEDGLADAYLLKPFGLEALVQGVEQMLEQQQSHQTLNELSLGS